MDPKMTVRQRPVPFKTHGLVAATGLYVGLRSVLTRLQ
jgi:hypothetical protein